MSAVSKSGKCRHLLLNECGPPLNAKGARKSGYSSESHIFLCIPMCLVECFMYRDFDIGAAGF